MKSLFTAAMVFLASAVFLRAADEAPKDPNEMIKQVRLSATLQKAALYGDVRKGRTKTPVALFLEGENMQFKLGNDDSNRFHIQMGDESCTLKEVGDNGKTTPFPASKLTSPVTGTDVTYEDLTLRFLYWPKAKFEPDDHINGEDCYRIRLDNPGKDGAFGVVYVFIAKKYNAFWAVRAHDRKGQLIKEFQVKDVMRLPGGGYTIKRMEIDAMTQKNGENRIASQTFLEFNDAEASKK